MLRDGSMDLLLWSAAHRLFPAHCVAGCAGLTLAAKAL
jgi:hypothetical protein